MPPVLTTGPSAPPRPAGPPSAPLTARDRARRVRFRRAMALMLMTLLVPGSAQLVAGNRRVGRVALRIWLGALLVGGLAVLTALAWEGFAYWLLADATALGVVRVLLIVAAVGWAGLFVDAWRIGQPLTLQRNQRLAAVGVNGLLCLAVAGTLLFGAHLVGVQRQLILTMFGDGAATAATHGRFNVLLLGGDSGAGRWGLRPDSITVASVDALTGRTVLIGLPRNMAGFPFADGSVMAEQFPDGFDCEGCYLNGVSTWAQNNTGLFGRSRHPGVDATVQAVEGITGLKVNYWVMVNLQGFKDLVDAMGGVTLNVRDRIPVGGLGDDVTGYLEPGVRKLDGFETLWFARAREGSDDYSRMARQKCVLGAMAAQISPRVAVRNFAQLARASSDMVSTNLPASELDRFIPLALKARSQRISTLSLVPPLVNTADPDITQIQDEVAGAIARAEEGARAPAAGPRKRRDQPLTGGSLGSMSTGYAANQADDLATAC